MKIIPFSLGLVIVISLITVRSVQAQQAHEFFFGGNFFVSGQSTIDDQKFLVANRGETSTRSIQYHLLTQAGLKINSNWIGIGIGYQRVRTKNNQDVNTIDEIVKNRTRTIGQNFYFRLFYGREFKLTQNVWLIGQLNLDYSKVEEDVDISFVRLYPSSSGSFHEEKDQGSLSTEIDYFNPTLSIGARVAVSKSLYLEILYGKLGYRWDLEKEIASKGHDIDFSINTLTLGVKYVLHKSESKK